MLDTAHKSSTSSKSAVDNDSSTGGVTSKTLTDSVKGSASGSNPENEEISQELKDRVEEAFDARVAKAGSEGERKSYRDKKADFLASFDTYAQRAVNRKTHKNKTLFYEQYISGDYEYSKQSIDAVKKNFVTTGASAIVNGWNVKQAFEKYQKIGRVEGNFVTSLQDDLRLCTNDEGENFKKDRKTSTLAASFNSPETVANAKGLREDNYSSYGNGMIMYEYSPGFIADVNDQDRLITPNGHMEGSNALNLPGMMTWGGNVENVDDIDKVSEDELVVPAIDVSQFKSKDVLSSLLKERQFKINRPKFIVAKKKRNRTVYKDRRAKGSLTIRALRFEQGDFDALTKPSN